MKPVKNDIGHLITQWSYNTENIQAQARWLLCDAVKDCSASDYKTST